MSFYADKTALVTGASSGIGEALAVELARRGAAAVGLVARRTEQLEGVAERVREHGAQAQVLAADVADLDQVRRAVSAFRAEHGFPDFAFGNAGIGDLIPADRFSAEAVRTIMETNFFGVVHLLDALLPDALREHRGWFVITSSVAAYRGIPGLAAYSASKAALDRLVEGLRVEARPRGVRFTLVEPGFVRTPMVARNPFPMPFIVEAQDAARRILDGVRRGKRRITFPTPVAAGMKALGILPDAVYDGLLGLAARARKVGAKGRSADG